MQLCRYSAGSPTSCNGAISCEFPNRSTTDLITPAVIPESIGGARRAAWTTLFTGVLDAAMRALPHSGGTTVFSANHPRSNYRLSAISANAMSYSSEQLVAECLERLRYEGNTHLLNVKEFPSILEELQCRVDEIKSIERSRLGRGISQIRQRYRFAKVIYPRSPMRRVTYQIRGLLDTLVRASRATAARLSGFGSIDKWRVQYITYCNKPQRSATCSTLPGNRIPPDSLFVCTPIPTLLHHPRRRQPDISRAKKVLSLGAKMAVRRRLHQTIAQ